MRKEDHACPAAGCTERCDPARLMCPQHWEMVPVPLQKRIWKHWKRGTLAEYVAARREAVAYVNRVLAVPV